MVTNWLVHSVSNVYLNELVLGLQNHFFNKIIYFILIYYTLKTSWRDTQARIPKEQSSY